MNFVKRIAKAIVGAVTTVLSLPIVQNIISEVPLEWTLEHVIAGLAVGVTVYAVPNKKEANQ